MKFSATLSVGIPIFLLAACTTHFTAVRVLPGSNVPVAGAPYNLTFTQFNLTVKRHVQSCFKTYTDEDLAEFKKLARVPPIIPEVSVKVDAEATKSEVRDPQRTYVIDLTSLQSFFKTTDVKVSYYDTGAIKSVNASSEDKAGEFAASVAQTLGKLVVAGIAKEKKPEVRCEENVAKAVASQAAKKAALTALTAKLEMTTEQVRQYTALATALGRNMSPVDRRQLSELVRKLIEQQTQQGDLKKVIELDLKLITVVDEFKWPNDGETFVSAGPALDPVDEKVLKRWIGAPTAPFAAETAVYLRLAASEAIGRRASCGQKCADDEYLGLKYRMPAQGKLAMCESGSSDTINGVAKPYTCTKWAEISKSEAISQLGHIHTLPLQSALFSSKSLSATFSESGVPTLLGVGATAASDQASKTFGGLGDAAVSIHASRAGREVAELESKLKLLKLKKEYEVATSVVPPSADSTKQDATAAFGVDTALIKAELANIEAKKALDEVKKLL